MYKWLFFILFSCSFFKNKGKESLLEEEKEEARKNSGFYIEEK